MEELDRGDRDAGRAEHMDLDRHVVHVLRLHRGRGLDLDHRPVLAAALEDVHRHEDAVGLEGRLVDARRPSGHRLLRGSAARFQRGDRHRDEHAARIPLPRRLAHLPALRVEVELDRVRAELLRASLAGLPPQQPVAAHAIEHVPFVHGCPVRSLPQGILQASWRRS